MNSKSTTGLIIITFLTAVMMECIGSYISVMGLSKLFASDWVTISIAVTLDIAKIVSVSYLYQFWRNVGIVFRSYMVAAVIVLMCITSIGSYGYLSNQFQRAMTGSIDISQQQKTIEQQIIQLNSEKNELTASKLEFDKQISRIDDDNIRGKQRLVATFKPEYMRINNQIDNITKQLSVMLLQKQTIDAQSVKTTTETGPILYLSQVLKVDPVEISKWIILIIILVFDPLAVCLIIAGNSMIRLSKKQDIPVEPIESVDHAPDLKKNDIIKRKKSRQLKQPVKSKLIVSSAPSQLDSIKIDDRPLGYSTLASSSMPLQ